MARSETASPKADDVPFEWSTDLSVGVPEIGADHQVLIDLVAQIRVAGEGAEARAVVGTVLNALVDYTDYHFTREERMQEAVGYPQVEGHKARHDHLRRQVIEYQRLFTEGPSSVGAAELAEFLRQWLIQHIMREDMAYRPFVENNPLAREAAASIGLEFFIGAMDADEESANEL